MHHKTSNHTVWKRSAALILPFVVVGILWLLMKLFVCEIPPDALTKTTMGRIHVRINGYFYETASLPLKLEELRPDDPRYNQSIKDGWGVPIRYSVDGTTVTLLSLGKDNSIGGEGENKDISLSFDPNNYYLEPVEFQHSRK